MGRSMEFGSFEQNGREKYRLAIDLDQKFHWTAVVSPYKRRQPFFELLSRGYSCDFQILSLVGPTCKMVSLKYRTLLNKHFGGFYSS